MAMWVGFEDAAAGAWLTARCRSGWGCPGSGAAAPDVEGLGALADGEDGLVEVEGVLDEELVDGGAGGVGVAALGMRDSPYFWGSMSAGLPGRRIPWQVERILATRWGDSWSGMGMGVAPAE
jgi:hypothetical protein